MGVQCKKFLFRLISFLSYDNELKAVSELAKQGGRLESVYAGLEASTRERENSKITSNVIEEVEKWNTKWA